MEEKKEQEYTQEQILEQRKATALLIDKVMRIDISSVKWDKDVKDELYELIKYIREKHNIDSYALGISKDIIACGFSELGLNLILQHRVRTKQLTNIDYYAVSLLETVSYLFLEFIKALPLDNIVDFIKLEKINLDLADDLDIFSMSDALDELNCNITIYCTELNKIIYKYTSARMKESDSIEITNHKAIANAIRASYNIINFMTDNGYYNYLKDIIENDYNKATEKVLKDKNDNLKTNDEVVSE